jgi:hypothetical protein
MRALVLFAAYSGMRPGELFAPEHDDVDRTATRIDVRRRLYRGRVDLPKSSKPRRIALTPPALGALHLLPHRTGLVFPSKQGRRLSQPRLSGYWGKVLAGAGLEFDFYLATKHWAVGARRHAQTVEGLRSRRRRRPRGNRPGVRLERAPAPRRRRVATWTRRGHRRPRSRSQRRVNPISPIYRAIRAAWSRPSRRPPFRSSPRWRPPHGATRHGSRS